MIAFVQAIISSLRGLLSYQLILEKKNGYLHVVVCGDNTPETVAAYIQQVHQECKARGDRRVLIEERLEGTRLGTLDVYEIASRAASQARGDMDVVAFVDVNATEETMARFAANVASNKGVQSMAFNTVSEAEDWMERQI